MSNEAKLTPEEKGAKKAALTRKRKIRKLIVQIALAALVLIIILVVLFFVLFRVRSFKVQGSSQYNTAEFMQNCGINTGSNIFFVDTDAAAARIEKALPYTDNVKVTRRLPSTIVISADQAKATYTVIMSGGLFALTDSDLKVLEVTADVPAGSIIVQGNGESFNYEIGSELPFASASGGDDVISDALKEVSAAIAENKLDGIEYINVVDADSIYLIYDDRIIIRVGSTEDISKKIALAKKAIDEENQLSSSQYGEMNVTVTKKAIFAPKDYKDMTDLIAYDDYITASETAGQETAEPVTDENGEPVTDEDGETVTEAETEAEEESSVTEETEA